MGKYQEINHGITSRINSMIALKMSKSEMVKNIKDQYIEKNGSDKGWSDRMALKNDHLRSVNSIETMRAAQKSFVNWARAHDIRKFEKITKADIEHYLVDRAEEKLPDGTVKERSAWVISRDLMFCNKVLLQSKHLKLEQQLTKRDLGLKSRCQSAVTRGRSNDGIPSNRPGLREEYRDHIDVARGTGARRESITAITYDRFRFNEGGLPVSVTLCEKGGKIRDAYILPSYQECIKEILEPHKDSDKPIFKDYDRHINNHHFRHEYACDLISQLQREHDRNEPYFNGEFTCEYRISDKEREMFPNGFKEYDLEPAAMLSQCLGHNRIDVLKSYVW